MIHIVFNEPDIEVLKKAIELDETILGEVVQIKDDYAVGPLAQMDDAEGWQARRDWWRMLLENSGDYKVDETLDMVDDKMTVHQLKKKLEEDENEVLWIWAAQNKHDVSGYYWLISQLQPLQGRVFILYLNNLPFLSEKGSIFYPQWLSQIPPKEYLKAKKLARLVTPSEFEVDGDEWKKLCGEGKMVRLLEGGKKLTQEDEDFYDKALAKYVYGDFAKANRILSQFFSKEKETTGDVFLTWRMKLMIEPNGWELRGDMQKGTKEFELRNPAMPSLKKKAAEIEGEEA
ncbi:MAG TPA: DUF1835 domain-containing protein [Phnomibacter sp.]|nr:DUF1835 domain-containing protein [Phnomibacter sp.]